MAVIIGIDFGTSYSAVSFVYGGQAVLLAPGEEQNAQQIPTVLTVHNGKKSVGSRALRIARRSVSGDSVRMIKRQYRRPQDWTLGGESFSSQDVVTEIMGYLIQGAQESLREQYRVTDEELRAVICKPVRYGQRWVQMLEQALQERGIGVEAVLTEPEAAAYHCLRRETDVKAGELVLVFDLGGGTCDVALVERTNQPSQPFAVLTQAYEPLGGVDWDERMQDILGEQIVQALDGLEEKTRMQVERHLQSADFQELAREMKENLTKQDEWEEEIEIKDHLFHVTVSREEFERRTRNLLERAMQAAVRVVSERGGKQLNHILLVGGGSRMPQIRSCMSELFPDSEIRLSEPEVSVAMGAAEFGLRPGLMLRKATHSYGIGFVSSNGKMVCNQLYKGDPLPAQGESVWSIRKGIVVFDVYEGEAERGEEVVPVGQTEWVMQVRCRVPGDAGKVKSHQVLSLEQDGQLRVSVQTEGEDGSVRQAATFVVRN